MGALHRRTIGFAHAAVALALICGPATPAQGHAGSSNEARPFVTGVEPATDGVSASVRFAGEWQLSLSVSAAETVTVLDADGRPFLRIGPDGTEGDYGALAWYTSAILSRRGAGKVRPPDRIGPDSPPDWRLVTSAPAWSWYDPRALGTPGEVTNDMIRGGKPVRLRDFAVPITVGEEPAQITGYLEYEPLLGAYRHTILSDTQPATGVEIDVLAGQAVPTPTIVNTSGVTVTVLGSEGEPFARVDGDAADANLASPTWMVVGRSLGLLPTTVADADAPPRWEPIGPGVNMSWPDFRSRPPDDEPNLIGLPSGGALVVKRWRIPFQVGEEAMELRGVTEFVPFEQPSERSSATLFLAVAGGVAVLGAAVVLLPRRGRTKR